MSIDPSAYADPRSPMLVGVAGGSDAGKGDVCQLLKNSISTHYTAKVVVLSLTDYYCELTTEERALFEQGRFNLDHPNVFDFELLETTLKSLLAGKPTDAPVWDKVLHKRADTQRIDPSDVIIIEGTLLLYTKSIRDLMFMKLFIDVDSDQRLTRRVQKAKTRNERTMTIKELLTEYVEFVKPMFDDFVLPTKKYADIIIPRGVENTPAIQVMVHHLEDHLKSRSKDSKKLSRKDSQEEDVDTASVSHKHHRFRDVLKTRAESAYKLVPE
ncbi:uridine kinase family-domain-containing protein [Spinellus fusiger]|nr:uridine kinase family-domain-containing protein [Spinellus fusiger]